MTGIDRASENYETIYKDIFLLQDHLEVSGPCAMHKYVFDKTSFAPS